MYCFFFLFFFPTNTTLQQVCFHKWLIRIHFQSPLLYVWAAVLLYLLVMSKKLSLVITDVPLGYYYIGLNCLGNCSFLTRAFWLKMDAQVPGMVWVFLFLSTFKWVPCCSKHNSEVPSHSCIESRDIWRKLHIYSSYCHVEN